MRILSVCWLLPIAVLATTIPPKVQLGKTTLTGLDLPALKQEFFGGIPFAQPPLGDLRFRPPQLLRSPSVSLLDATSFGPICPQANAADVSEDCLTVNVFRPAKISSTANLPVMLWVYGGGFLTGSSSGFNGSEIVARSIERGTPIIYVNFNYRLGPLGFPQGTEAVNEGALNLGLKDQLTAMQWVQENIGTFGGDKTKVTLFGESAGAISIAMLFLNSDIEKLARAAIFESGLQSSNRVFGPLRNEPFFQSFIQGIPECNGVDVSSAFSCLRKANLSTILTSESAVTGSTDELFPFGPVIDGPGGIIPDIPSKLLSEGKFSRLPFISGTNRDEGTIFVPQSINSTSQIIALLTDFDLPETEGKGSLSSAISNLLLLYPDDPALGSPFGTGNETFGLSPVFKRAAAILGDLFFQSTKREWLGAASSRGVTIFGYHFSDSQGNASTGVHHDSEIPYVYGQLSTSMPMTSQILSRQMSDYWISFATSLTPNDNEGVQRPLWPQFKTSNKVLIQLNGQNLTIVPDTFRNEQISFINSIPLVFHH